MKQTTLYILILLSALLAACTADDLPDTGTTPNGGSLRIAYRVAGTDVQTKADTEPGTDALNENKVTRLDFFAFQSNGSLLAYIPLTDVPDDSPSDSYVPLAIEEDELSLDDVQSNTGGSYYLVANCPSVANITTLAALQAALTQSTDPALITDGTTPPNAFVMDAQAIPAASGKDITLQFDLRRAAAKIRLNIDGSVLPRAIQLIHYADQAYVASGTTDYACTLQSTAETGITITYPLRETGSEGTGGYVFYSYPNDWFNTSLFTPNADGIWTCNDDGLHNGEPVLEERQTYLLLKARYNSTDYYYRIPVNSRLPQFSDKPTFTSAEVQQVHDLCRLKRNHLYAISATIDGPGGTLDDPVVPKYTITINDWENGRPDDGRYELPPGDFQPSTQQP